jgi:TRAP-type C4-dicarboxylate transport system permease small subunit
MQAHAIASDSRLARFNASPLGKAYIGMIKLCDAIAATVLSIFAVFVTTNVIGRFIFNKTFGWMEEVCTMLLLWMVTMGTVGLLERYGLFYAEVLLMFLKSEKLHKAIFVFNSLILIAIFGVMIHSGTMWVWVTRGFELDYTYMYAYWFYAALPIWGVIMMIVVIKKLIFMQNPDVTEVEAEIGSQD